MDEFNRGRNQNTLTVIMAILIACFSASEIHVESHRQYPNMAVIISLALSSMTALSSALLFVKMNVHDAYEARFVGHRFKGCERDYEYNYIAFLAGYHLFFIAVFSFCISQILVVASIDPFVAIIYAIFTIIFVCIIPTIYSISRRQERLKERNKGKREYKK